MSSHHFVKEGQEPALVILEAYSLEAVEPLLEWAPLVVVSDRVLDDVLHWGIKIDVVITSKDKIDALESQLSDQGPVKFLLHSLPGDRLPTLFQFLKENNQNGVTVVCNSYHDIINMAKPFGEALDISILTSSLRWSFISVGHFKKWLPAGSTLFVQAVQPVNFKDERFLPQLATDRISATADGIISLESTEGFWVGEPVS